MEADPCRACREACLPVWQAGQRKPRAEESHPRQQRASFGDGKRRPSSCHRCWHHGQCPHCLHGQCWGSLDGSQNPGPCGRYVRACKQWCAYFSSRTGFYCGHKSTHVGCPIK
jgi:hypothetical protein